MDELENFLHPFFHPYAWGFDLCCCGGGGFLISSNPPLSAKNSKPLITQGLFVFVLSLLRQTQ